MRTYVNTTHIPFYIGPIVGVYDSELPREFELLKVYPNPFNVSTNFQFASPHNSVVQLDIFDLTGRLINSQKKIIKTRGIKNITWSGNYGADKWRFIACTYDGSNSTISVDAGTRETQANTKTTTPTALYVGTYSTTPTLYELDGQIADVMIFDEVLSEEAIAKISEATGLTKKTLYQVWLRLDKSWDINKDSCQSLGRSK